LHGGLDADPCSRATWWKDGLEPGASFTHH
jgi:hypothetical protein